MWVETFAVVQTKGPEIGSLAPKLKLDVIAGICDSSVQHGRQNQQILKGHWPASIAKMVSSQVIETPCFKNLLRKKWRVIEEDM